MRRAFDLGPSWVVLGLAFALALPGTVRAQSLFSSSGSGMPTDAPDARSRALGGVGIGLFGPAVLPRDPAAAADLIVPELSFSFHQSWLDLEGSSAGSASGARFPLLAIAYPLRGRGVFTLTFSGVLDQKWNAEVEQVIDLGDELARVTDRFVSDGGLAAVRLGYARRLSEAVSLGASVGRYTGDVTRTFSRRFDSLSVESNVPSYSIGGLWGYEGHTATVGGQVDVGEIARVAGSWSWSGDVTATPSADTEGGSETFQISSQLNLGASGALAPGVNLTVGVQYADWSDIVDPDLEKPGTIGFGIGLEWEDASVLTSQSPLRLGWRRTPIPFGFDGEKVDESAWTAGIGLNLVQANDVPLARVDLAVERGSRSASSLMERFWRASLSVRVAGF